MGYPRRAQRWKPPSMTNTCGSARPRSPSRAARRRAAKGPRCWDIMQCSTLGGREGRGAWDAGRAVSGGWGAAGCATGALMWWSSPTASLAPRLPPSPCMPPTAPCAPPTAPCMPQPPHARPNRPGMHAHTRSLPAKCWSMSCRKGGGRRAWETGSRAGVAGRRRHGSQALGRGGGGCSWPKGGVARARLHVTLFTWHNLRPSPQIPGPKGEPAGTSSMVDSSLNRSTSQLSAPGTWPPAKSCMAAHGGGA